VANERVEFFSRVPVAKYLQLFNVVDIALDTFPYGGGTTTFDSLWMGVPVVTATGSIPVSRSASSILQALGLDEWIAPCIEDYVGLAVERASDRQGIQHLRRTLRQSMKESPLTDVPLFVHDLEHAYREMWIACNDHPYPTGKPSDP
jgi:predicted O-linked N-acetylglucosamine transferase (SPINDLY family)